MTEKKTIDIPDSSRRFTTRQILIAAILAIIIAIPFGLGKFCEFNSPGAFDSGANVYSAKHILDGAVIGVDERPSAQLGTLLMNIAGVWMFGYNDIGPKIIQMILQAGALLLLFVTLKRLFNTAAAFTGTLVASFYLSAPVIAKFGNVKEQYMIAFMLLGVCSYALRFNGGKWWWAFLSGVFIAWAPLFKQTGYSCWAAVGFFIFISAILRWRNFKLVLADLGFIFAGMVAAMAPLYIWILAGDIKLSLPHSILWDKVLSKLFTPSKESGTIVAEVTKGYVSKSREAFDFSKQFPIVMRYYATLILPITIALLALLVAKIRVLISWFAKRKQIELTIQDKIVFLFGGMWVLDMVFVWISPRSYEQYYLPLCASGAATGAYIIWQLSRKIKTCAPANKGLWIGLNGLGIVAMIVMSWSLFFGLSASPFSGQKYKDPDRRRGYVQRLKEANEHRKGKTNAWEKAGLYIQENTSAEDKIYVWGWYPGIYVTAQRLAPTRKAFESEMHTKSPEYLEYENRQRVKDFQKNPPKYIVDSRKRHFPWNRPPLELWPSTQRGFLPTDANIVAGYEHQYSKMLAENIDKDEAKRFEAMKPLRDYIRKNYRIVDANNYRFMRGQIYHYKFGTHVIFERIK